MLFKKRTPFTFRQILAGLPPPPQPFTAWVKIKPPRVEEHRHPQQVKNDKSLIPLAILSFFFSL